MYRIVVIEDSKLLRTGMIHTWDWKRLDCQIVGSAGDGIEGLQVICDTKPDVVLTDIRLPGLNGLDMIESARKQGISPAVIIISGYDEFSYAQKALTLGAVAYLVKPVEEEDAYRAIQSACERVDEQRKYRNLTERLENIENSKMQVFNKYLASSEGIKSEYTRQAIRYIEEHFADDISVRSIAEALAISESHLSKVFKDTMHCTIGEYLIQYRIREACTMLKDPQNRIYEVAVRCGYNDQRYFSVIFKRMMGMTPNEFRTRSIK